MKYIFSIYHVYTQPSKSTTPQTRNLQTRKPTMAFISFPLILTAALLSSQGSLASFDTEIQNQQGVCSDRLFFEKGQVSSYYRISRRRGYMRTSTPALDMVIDLEKNDFGSIDYNEELKDGVVLMLHAYKSSQNLHIYKICPSNSGNYQFNVTGPLVKKPRLILGYHMSINDLHRLNKHLVDNYFHIFGEDIQSLKMEIWEDREEDRKKQQVKNGTNNIKAALTLAMVILMIIMSQPGIRN